MNPYHDLGLFSFLAVLLKRLALFIALQLAPHELVIEDLQFQALLLSGLLGLYLGFYLIYNKMAMVANSLSHTVLLGLVLVFIAFKSIYAITAPDSMPFWALMSASMASSLLTVMLIRYLSKRVSMEASNAFSFTAFFALGILLSSVLLKNTHLGLESVLGDLEVIQFSDISRLFWTLILVLSFFILLKSRLLLASFDPIFTKTLGYDPEKYRGVLIFLAALCLGVCFRALGVILVLTLLTAPVLIARLFFHDRKKLFALGAAVVLIQSALSLAIVQEFYVSMDLPLSTSGLFGFMGLVAYLLALGIRRVSSKKKGSLTL